MTTASRSTPIAPFTQVLDHVPIAPNPAMQLRLLAAAAQTGGSAGFLEATFPAGSGVPMHIHHTEDEIVFVLEGAFLFVVEAARIDAGPNTFIFVPRGVPHGFRSVGNVPGRYLEAFVPGGFETWFANPDPSTAAQHGFEAVGPMPE